MTKIIIKQMYVTGNADATTESSLSRPLTQSYRAVACSHTPYSTRGHHGVVVVHGTVNNTRTASSSPDEMVNEERCGLTVVVKGHRVAGVVLQEQGVVVGFEDDPAVCVNCTCQPVGRQAANGMPSVAVVWQT